MSGRRSTSHASLTSTSARTYRVPSATDSAQAFDRWAVALAAALRRGGLSKARAGRVSALTISAFEGAIELGRAHRALDAFDDVARELDQYLASLETS